MFCPQDITMDFNMQPMQPIRQKQPSLAVFGANDDTLLRGIRLQVR